MDGRAVVNSNGAACFKPVQSGNISSGFGRRSDPLTGAHRDAYRSGISRPGLET